MTADTLFRSLEASLISPGDLVIYSGSKTELHGLMIANPCQCFWCPVQGKRGSADIRYALTDPWAGKPSLICVRRQSITRARGGQ